MIGNKGGIVLEINYWILRFTGITTVIALISVLICRRTNFSLWYIYPIEKRKYNRITMLLINITTFISTIVLIKELKIISSISDVLFWIISGLIIAIILFISFLLRFTNLPIVKNSSSSNEDTIEDFIARTLTLFNCLVLLLVLITFINIDPDTFALENETYYGLINAFKPFVFLIFATSSIASYLLRVPKEDKGDATSNSAVIGDGLSKIIAYREKIILCNKINRR